MFWNHATVAAHRHIQPGNDLVAEVPLIPHKHRYDGGARESMNGVSIDVASVKCIPWGPFLSISAFIVLFQNA